MNTRRTNAFDGDGYLDGFDDGSDHSFDHGFDHGYEGRLPNPCHCKLSIRHKE